MTRRPGLDLDGVVLLGRTFDEYLRCFGLAPADLTNARVLDVGGGVSSFTAEANALGIAVTAADPIYAAPAEAIERKCAADLERVMAQMPAIAPQYRWDFYRDVAHLRALRTQAYQAFLADYGKHGAARYRAAALPELPFPDGAFTHVLVSHLLFLYDEALDLAFHRAAVRSLVQAATREVRIYPLVNLKGERCAYVEDVSVEARSLGLHVEERPVDFEFLRGAITCLVMRRP